ncbi:MAG: hypothetical protein C0503_00840 [Gemmatimonas sp.]|nr:hypothetical protein [Gemmatimonas sp.]
MPRPRTPLPEMGADSARPQFRQPARPANRLPQIRSVQNAADESADLFIYDIIGWGGVTAQLVAEHLSQITAPTIHVRINSGGGDVFEGIAIYNALLRARGRVVTHVDGVAASAASIIALAGQEVLMAQSALAMIHSAWGCVCGNTRELRRVADLLDKVDGQLAGVYARQMDITPEAALALMEAETWMNADEAVAQGFADDIEDREAVEASFDWSLFKNTPDRLAASRGSARGNASKPQTIRELEAVLRDAGYSRTEAARIAASGFATGTPARDEPPAPSLSLSPLEALAATIRSHSQR